MRKRRLLSTLVLTLVVLATVAVDAAADNVKTNDFCFAVLGFEGDGGPIFVIVDEKEFRKTGAFVGPPRELVPAGFLVNPESDVTFEYRGTIAAGRAALEGAGFKECPDII